MAPPIAPFPLDSIPGMHYSGPMSITRYLADGKEGQGKMSPSSADVQHMVRHLWRPYQEGGFLLGIRAMDIVQGVPRVHAWG